MFYSSGRGAAVQSVVGIFYNGHLPIPGTFWSMVGTGWINLES